MKTNLKTFWDSWAKVPEKCRQFNYDNADVGCRHCPHSFVCQFMKKLTAELQEMLKHQQELSMGFPNDPFLKLEISIYKEILGED